MKIHAVPIFLSTTLKWPLSIMCPEVQLKPKLAVEPLPTASLVTSVSQVLLMSSLAIIHTSPEPVTLPTCGAGVVLLSCGVQCTYIRSFT